MEVFAPFRIVKLQKHNGEFREIYVPCQELKALLQSIAPAIARVAAEYDVAGVQHGFTIGRSPVTNAREHTGWPFTVTMDLKSFFDTVSKNHLIPYVDTSAGGMILKDKHGRIATEISDCFIHGRARQGLPTSPAISNLAAHAMDMEILSLCPKGRFAEQAMKFTRYADDLTFSCRTMATVNFLLQEIPRIVEKHGFKINSAKTRVQAAVAGRRIITGVAVGEHDVTITREVRRRIRAGHHQDQHGLRKRNIRRMLFWKRKWKKHLPLRLRFYWQLNGLVEWSRLKTPKEEQKVAKNVVVRAAARVVAAVCGQSVSNRITNAWSRRFG